MGSRFIAATSDTYCYAFWDVPSNKTPKQFPSRSVLRHHQPVVMTRGYGGRNSCRFLVRFGRSGDEGHFDANWHGDLETVCMSLCGVGVGGWVKVREGIYHHFLYVTQLNLLKKKGGGRLSLLSYPGNLLVYLLFLFAWKWGVSALLHFRDANSQRKLADLANSAVDWREKKKC